MIALWLTTTVVILATLNAVIIIRAKVLVEEPPPSHFETSMAINKFGKDGTYFGFSVAGHIEVKPITGELVPWLLVGSPLGKNYQPNTNRSGALFKCPISNLTDDCIQVYTDIGNAKLFDNITINDIRPPNNQKEIKENQWLGGTVRSGGIGGKAIVCAHRYIEKIHRRDNTPDYLGTGLCYLLPNNLDRSMADTLQPCSKINCQAGLSAAIVDERTILIGVPNKGNVYKYTYKQSTSNKGLKFELKNNTDIIRKKNGNFGMAMTIGRYFQKETIAFAVGSPRFQQVLVYASIEDSNPHIIKIDAYCSNFGYELITADMNGDSWPDLIVGAPMYFTGDKERNGGAVFVYHNARKLPSKPKPFGEYTQTLFVATKTDTSFGLSMANLGDINNDKCEDIAVGAPYEDDGVVYIYLGSKIIERNPKPSEVIRPSDFPKFLANKPIKAFGYSLSGGVDFDLNSYADLLIGSINSDSVMAVPTRPVFNIQISIDKNATTNIDQWNKPSCAIDWNGVVVCFELDIGHGLVNVRQRNKFLDQLYLFRYKIVALKSVGQTFDVKIDCFPNKFCGSSEIQLSTNGIFNHQKYIVYVNKTLATDVLHSIKFQIDYSYQYFDGIINPFLDATTMTHTFMTTFRSNCEGNCSTNLEIRSAILLGLPFNDSSYLLVLGTVSKLELQINVRNNLNPAFNAQLVVEHHVDIRFIDDQGLSKCAAVSDHLVKCDLGNPYDGNSETKITMRFSLGQLRPSRYNFTVYTNTTSYELVVGSSTIVHCLVQSSAELLISAYSEPDQVDLNDIAIPDEVRFLEDIGPLVRHIYNVRNNGTSPGYDLVVRIQWPYQTVGHKPLLYLLDVPVVLIEGIESDDAFCEQNEAVNAQQLTTHVVQQEDVDAQWWHRLVKRSLPTEELVSPKDDIIIDTINITCHIPLLLVKQEANITINSRLWIESNALNSTRNFRIASQMNIIQSPAGNATLNAMAITTFVPTLNQMSWLIILTWLLATIVGVFSLSMITLYMARWGFFKRNRVDKTLYRETKVRADAVRASMRQTLRKTRQYDQVQFNDDSYLLEQQRLQYEQINNDVNGTNNQPLNCD